MNDRIHLTMTDGVADVRLNRADKMNTLDPAMVKAIAETGARLKEDTSVHAVVLKGLKQADIGERSSATTSTRRSARWLWCRRSSMQ